MVDMIAREMAVKALQIGAPTDEQIMNAVSLLADEGKITTGATAVQVDQIEKNNSMIVQLSEENAKLDNRFTVSENVYNPSTQTDNMIINVSGVETSSMNYDTGDYIEIPDGERYIYISTSLSDELEAHYTLALYDSSKNFLGRYGYPTKVVSVNNLPTNASYVRFSHKHASNIMILFGTTEFTTDEKEFVAYGDNYIKREWVSKWIKEAEENAPYGYKMNYIYVATTGSDSTGDGSKTNPYATIYYANNQIADNSEKNRYTIIVGQGIYTDLQTTFSGMSVADFNSKYQGVVCKDYVYYESENIDRPELCTIEWDGSTGLGTDLDFATTVYTKCPFHIGLESDANLENKGLHTHVKGFTFNVSNCRYALHTESGNRGLNVDWEVANCVFNWGGRPACTESSNVNPFVVGSGLSAFERGKFSRCIFNNSADNLGWYGHDGIFKSSYGYTPFILDGAVVEFEHCNFNGLDVRTQSIRAGALFGSKNECVLNGCKGINTLSYTYGSGNTDNSWTISDRACEIATDNRQLI